MPSVRATDSPFVERNRSAHLARWRIDLPAHVDAPGLAVDCTAGGSDAPDCWPFSGRLTMRVEAAPGVWHKMHSDRRPVDEAEAWARSVLVDGDPSATGPIIVVGAGLGYIVEVLTRSPDARILVLEPEPAAVPWLLARRDWTSLISAGRLMILPGPRYDAVARALPFLRGAEQSAPPVLSHPVLARVRPDAIDQARHETAALLHGVRANALARRRFEAPYLLNTLTNLGTVLRCRGIDTLRAAAAGRPVVIAGAGPSLNRNVDELRPWRHQVTLVATDTALRPLNAAGMPPDFVVAVDPGPLNARHLTNLVVDDTTTLLAESSLDPDALPAFRNRILTFRVADHAPWPWLISCGVNRGTLRAWGSVLTTAFDVALEMRGDPIVFIGADLSYTLGQPYCRDTTYEDDWARAASEDGRTLADVWDAVTSAPNTTADDVHGASVRTAPHLLAFRDWIVRAAEAVGTDPGSAGRGPRVVNATGAGILHGPGIALAPLADIMGLRTGRRPVEIAGRPPVAVSSEPTASAIDTHLLRHAATRGASFPATVDRPATRTPYLQRPRRERIAATRRLRHEGSTDRDRWSNAENLDSAWERRVVAAAELIPPGSRVLDLGAGRQALARHLPAGATYTPADLVPRSHQTVVADVNAGAFPDGTYDVVVMLGLLEHVHDVRRVLEAAARQSSTVVASYCAMTAWSRDFRLEKGWLNDLRLGDLVDLFGESGWNIAWAGRLDRLPHFDQWIFACRAVRPLR